MLQHSASDFYDLSANIVPGAHRQTPPSYSPNGAAIVALSNNNNNNNSLNNNNNNILELNSTGGAGGGSGGSGSGNEREAMPSFMFSQEQVACVCEVSQNDERLTTKKLYPCVWTCGSKEQIKTYVDQMLAKKRNVHTHI